ncbi:hypothetical protein NC651_020554 [Populus alba x Populus x berolinensis]|nr:hypothetical protein NC651_020554 [Populus alba x Populus x berolinensis]
MVSSTHRMNHVGVIHNRRNAWTDAQNKFQIERTDQGTSELIKHCSIELTGTESPESKRGRSYQTEGSEVGQAREREETAGDHRYGRRWKEQTLITLLSRIRKERSRRKQMEWEE